MILGVYWYFGFPEALYSYNYFQWRPGYGGHADNPASLEATVFVENPDSLIDQIRSLLKIYKEGFVYIYAKGNNLKIGTGAWQLHDYDFQLMLEVEKILLKEKAEVISTADFLGATFISIAEENQRAPQYPKKKIIHPVASSMKKCNAETSCLRMDCFVETSVKEAFLSALETITDEENFDVLFYNEKSFSTGSNLMIFFTNGRQWLQTGKREIDILGFENKLELLLQEYKVIPKHQGGWDYYPLGKSIVVKAVDKEFII